MARQRCDRCSEEWNAELDGSYRGMMILAVPMSTEAPYEMDQRVLDLCKPCAENIRRFITENKNG